MIIILGLLCNVIFAEFFSMPMLKTQIYQGITKIENLFRRMILKNETEKMLAGTILTVSMIFGSCMIVWLIQSGLGLIHNVLKSAIIIIFMMFALDFGSLRKTVMYIYESINIGNIEQARIRLSSITSWDTDYLDKEGVLKITIEELAKGISNSMIAPLLFYLIGGMPMMISYRMLDMINEIMGQENERYQDFGRFAQGLYSACEYIPCRISAVLLFLATKILKYNEKGAMDIFWRDRNKEKGYHRGQMLSVSAGALDIQLGGVYKRFTIPVKMQTIGDKNKNITITDLMKMMRLFYVSSGIGMVCAMIVSFVLH